MIIRRWLGVVFSVELQARRREIAALRLEVALLHAKMAGELTAARVYISFLEQTLNNKRAEILRLERELRGLKRD